jgi:hypothetical protein
MLSLRRLFILIVLLAGARLYASEYQEPFQTTHMLGMGGVYVFSSDDAMSTYQNPAYTCFTKGMNWTMANINVGLVANGSGTNVLQSASDNIQNVGNISSFTDLNSLYGDNEWFSAQGTSTFALPCFALGAYYTGFGDIVLHNPAYPTLQTLVTLDNGFVVGAAVPLGDHVALGLNAKRIVRQSVDQPLGADTLAGLSGSSNLQDTLQNLESSGVGYGLDAGIVARMDDQPLHPTVSLGLRDVGTTSFHLSSGTNTPPPIQDNMVIGMTIDGSIPLLGFAAGLEYRHIMDENTQFGQKIHLGGEVNLAFIDLRAGLYQGYMTYGAGIDFWFLTLDVASYSVERGYYPGQDPDQRIQAALSIQFSMDPDFHIVDFSTGARRHLKQRR